MLLHRFIIALCIFTSTVSATPQDTDVANASIESNNDTFLQNNRTPWYANIPITISSFNNLAKNNSDGDFESTSENIPIEKIEISRPTNVPLENNEFLRHAESDDVTDVIIEADRTEITTETDIATDYDVTTTAKPKTTLSPKPKFVTKFSYVRKSKKESVLTNSNSIKPYVPKFDKSYKRKFKSRCRCEKIDNCPKLQITVPRCPDEYFLCCF